MVTGLIPDQPQKTKRDKAEEDNSFSFDTNIDMSHRRDIRQIAFMRKNIELKKKIRHKDDGSGRKKKSVKLLLFTG